MHKKPIIGITTRNEDPDSLREKPYVQDYVIPIEQAGGQVRILPAGISSDDLVEEYAALDGLLFSGGGDVDSVLYKGLPHPAMAGVIPERDDMELKLIKMAILDGLPFLGICRGIQVMNVALGGTLYTDLPDQLGRTVSHSTPKCLPKDTINHTIQVQPGTWLAEITGQKELKVNSRHHQGIHRLAAGLQVMAISPDGLVEAVELPEHPFGVGVQWHPENLNDDPDARKLFSRLIQAALD